MAVSLGVNSGFVTARPTEDPTASLITLDFNVLTGKFSTSLLTGSIIEMGWWCDTATQEANFEIGIYSDILGFPGSLLTSSITNAKGTDSGWKRSNISFVPEPNTTYWLAVQLDNTATATNMDYSLIAGSRGSLSSASELPNPFTSGGFYATSNLLSIYALYESSPTTSYNIGNSFGGTTVNY